MNPGDETGTFENLTFLRLFMVFPALTAKLRCIQRSLVDTYNLVIIIQ